MTDLATVERFSEYNRLYVWAFEEGRGAGHLATKNDPHFLILAQGFKLDQNAPLTSAKGSNCPIVFLGPPSVGPVLFLFLPVPEGGELSGDSLVHGVLLHMEEGTIVFSA